VPRPLGAVEPLGLALTAAVGEEGLRPLSGTEMLRCTRGGVPAEALAAAATALAPLHRSAVRPQGERRDAAAVAKRVDLLAVHAPALAPRLRAAGDELARLLASDGAAPVPVHGGFKPSQLVYTGPRRVVVTDFDGVRLDDPALDVGYFLAYLRPASLWRDRAASRAWFTAAARVFTTAYARSMSGAGAPANEIAGILRRAPLHEAAALLKIAGRRPHRCNAPRPRELAALLGEVEDCIARARGVVAAVAV
jgi:aminoglycoside phosphotransferase (APT) family kinase protein